LAPEPEPSAALKLRRALVPPAMEPAPKAHSRYQSPPPTRQKKTIPGAISQPQADAGDFSLPIVGVTFFPKPSNASLLLPSLKLSQKTSSLPSYLISDAPNPEASCVRSAIFLRRFSRRIGD